MTVTDRIVELVRAIRDLFLIALGATVLAATPESLREFGLSGTGAQVWGAAVLLGAVCALYAGWKQRLLVEVWACCAVIGGLLFWIIGLTFRSDASITSWSVALVLACTICGEVVRIADTVGERKATR